MTSNRFIYFVLAAFVTGTLLLIYIQYNSSRNIDKLINGNKRLLNELKAGNDLRELERDILSVESKIRATVATGDTSYIIGTSEQIADAEAYLDTLKMMNHSPASVQDIDRLAFLARLKLRNRDQILDTLRLSGREAAARLITNPRSNGVANEINRITRKIYDNRRRMLADLSNATADNGRKARTWGTVLITLVLLSAGGLFWFIISRISQQNLLIRRLDRSEKDLRVAMQVKENFMANMSHEIRTPLNAVIGYTGLLKAQHLDPGSTEFVTAIEQAGNNLLTIINDILDLSKIEAGMMRLEAFHFSVRELTHSVEALFQEKIKEKGLTFRCIIEDEVPVMLIGDATRLTQILVNLIGNALKFTDKGQIELTLSAPSFGDHPSQLPPGNITRLGIRVSDTGIGIAKDKLDSIFDRFSQAEDSITRKYGGTGLGLAIVKDLVVLQQGEISVKSEEGKGTIFQLFIPYTISGEQQNPFVPSLSFDAPATGAHLLVVDDNAMNRDLMKHLLKSRGLSFSIVSNGREAIDQLRHNKYDMVLMDIQMPEMDGYTATREIRETLGLDIPVIAMTAHAMAGERERCLSCGMNEYLSKPVREQELFRMIASFRSYQYINLDYLQQLSQGNKEFEQSMTAQFLADTAEDLQAMGAAISGEDIPLLNRIAHNMKTNISIMGLTARLQPTLDALEFAQPGDASIPTYFQDLKTICEAAMDEARAFQRLDLPV